MTNLKIQTRHDSVSLIYEGNYVVVPRPSEVIVDLISHPRQVIFNYVSLESDQFQKTFDDLNSLDESVGVKGNYIGVSSPHDYSFRMTFPSETAISLEEKLK